ncbi:hypothetical protein MSAN_00131600 [Mycena sanguinolenta]|uniref:Uncharacterized protein n=1 Tax=Mycena sanguinolenta TaxID=230812 RepID=A0A8H7DMZ6_9AGAR|nr:hypothetical protein MSAN_00131600 [Mycena sanguinolenta]
MSAAYLDSLPIWLGAGPRRRKRRERAGRGSIATCRSKRALGRNGRYSTLAPAGMERTQLLSLRALLGLVCPPHIQASIVNYVPECAFPSTSTSYTCFRTLHAIVDHHCHVY